MTPSEQLEVLRKMKSSGGAMWLKYGLTLLAIGLAIAALVSRHPSQRWRFEFIPLGWQPGEGEFEAEFFAHPSVEWPALVQTTQGILYPRYNPKRVCAAPPPVAAGVGLRRP
jgi:hypothetical protein